MTIDEYRGNKELIAEINKVSRQNIGLMKINKIFEQQNADLVAALEFYAKLSNYSGSIDSVMDVDLGHVARQALAQVGK